MKKLFSLLAFLWLTQMPGMAQKTIFMFDDFIKVKVLFKNKSVGQVVANYDAGHKRLMFKQGGETLESTNTAVIDTIYFGERRFIPAEKGMTEVMKLNHGTVKIDWWLKDVLVGSKGAFGSVNQSHVQHVYGADMSGSEVGFSSYVAYENSRENDNEIYRRRNANVYTVTVEGKEYKLKELAQMYKRFPDKAEQLKAYAHEHNLDLRTADSALRMLDYLLSLYPN